MCGADVCVAGCTRGSGSECGARTRDHNGHVKCYEHNKHICCNRYLKWHDFKYTNAVCDLIASIK